MLHTLYFIESIKVPSIKREGGDNEYHVILEKVYSSDNQKQQSEFRSLSFGELPVLEETKTRLREGWYVYYNEELGSFSSARDDKFAIARRRENSRLRTMLINRDVQYEDERVFDNQTEVKSYHVNVGHGNCTILLIQRGLFYQIWMVDCGAIDQVNHVCYYENIRRCFADIASKLGVEVSKLHVSKFFLTHWHYDHISGMQFLLRDGLLDGNTLFYMNLYYAHSSGCANDLLKRLYEVNASVYEPTCKFSKMPAVCILYPECRVRKFPTPHDYGYHVVPKMNNSSVVYSIGIGHKTMLFPGDLEDDGWNSMTSARTCQKRPLCYTDFYCVSHHASITGHVDMPCLGKSIFSNVGDCLNRHLSKAIIMGRDGAYSGVYSPVVERYWSKIVRYSEKDNNGKSCKALVLDWSNNTESYIY